MVTISCAHQSPSGLNISPARLTAEDCSAVVCTCALHIDPTRKSIVPHIQRNTFALVQSNILWNYFLEECSLRAEILSLHHIFFNLRVKINFHLQSLFSDIICIVFTRIKLICYPLLSGMIWRIYIEQIISDMSSTNPQTEIWWHISLKVQLSSKHLPSNCIVQIQTNIQLNQTGGSSKQSMGTYK